MLFNSYEFILLFLPIALIGYFALGKTKKSELANVWLVVISLFFYSYWNIKYLPLLILSIAVNYILSGKIIAALKEKCKPRAKGYFILGMVFNVGLLGFYKYTDFLLENLNCLGADFNLLHIVLPLGISFFTLTQLAYIVDCYRNEVTDERHTIINYTLFVSFFPHLLAGPILYHKDMLGQFADKSLRHINWENMVRGSSLFIIGLAKKVLIADSLAPYVGTSFGAPAELTFFEAWAAALSYTLQLFFDFSGYSDMAVGIALMLNIRIPFNFNSPYRSYGVADFWRRWHMSLGAWVKNYLYIPLGGNRHGFVQKLRNLLVAMGIVGIWHGAGWTFIIWGIMHGIGLVADSVWKKFHLPMWKPLGYLLTFVFVLVAWVFFRADSVAAAFTILTAMFGGAPIVFPEKIAVFMNHYLGIIVPQLPHNWAAPKKFMLLATLMVIFLPSSQQIATTFRPRTRYAVALAVLMVVSLFSLTKVSEFLYFQF